MRGPFIAYAIPGVLLVAVFAPVIGNLGDSYPLSTYPMFSRYREPVGWVVRALRVAPDGTATPVVPAIVAEGEPMQAIVTLKRTFRNGRKASLALCREILERLDEDDALAVELRRDLIDAREHFADREAKAKESQLMARCERVQ
ncbi:MAG: hypothetical protein AAFU77_04690 [Myxococcota bacterium]